MVSSVLDSKFVSVEIKDFQILDNFESDHYSVMITIIKSFYAK